MTWYLISFDVHAMDHIPDEDMPAVAKAAHAVVEEAVHAGVLVCAGGLVGQADEHRGHRRDGHRRPVPWRPSAGSRSSTCPHARRRWSGRPRSPSPAAARKRSGRSGPTPKSARCSARQPGDGDVRLLTCPEGRVAAGDGPQPPAIDGPVDGDEPRSLDCERHGPIIPGVHLRHQTNSGYANTIPEVPPPPPDLPSVASQGVAGRVSRPVGRVLCLACARRRSSI